MFGLGKKSRIKREIVINKESIETRVAILENGKLEEFQIEHPTEERVVDSVYKGVIQNLEHDLQAAFVDIGMKKNAFLHYWDMVPSDDMAGDVDVQRKSGRHSQKRKKLSNKEIEKRFPPGSDVVVQVTKGPIGTKGPRVTCNLSLPGRYLVLMPGHKLKGVSRKIEDNNERQRLKKLLAHVPAPEGAGMIVRTAGAGAKKSNLIRDFEALNATWDELAKAMKESKAPACLYQEPDLVQRVVRDWLTEEVDRITVDSQEEYEKIRAYSAKLFRRAKSRIQRYQGDLPIFDHFDVERQIEEACQRRVRLKSGGYVVFDETEALIAVDVNTGKHKGKGSQEEVILAVNTEAVEEVARQLRLRNIGGLVVVDLVDMRSKKHQSAVFRSMKASLKRDKARTNVLPISELGIMEMTRQRVEESIASSMTVNCPYCAGRGKVKSPLGISVEIQRQLHVIMRRHMKESEHVSLQVVVHPTVLGRLKKEDEQFLLDLESKFEGRLSFRSDPGKHVEFFAIRNEATGETLFSSGEN